MSIDVKNRIPFLLIFILFFIYYRSLFYGFFSWDDNVYILNNPYLFKISYGSIKSIFLNPFNGNYNPLTLLSFSIDSLIGGQKAFIYHAHNLLLHLINTLLVFILVKKITKKLLISTIVALLFEVTALHIESVIWISERKDLLYSFYFLLAFLFYIKYSSCSKKKYFVFSVIFFLLSILSKGQAVVLPICLIVYDLLLIKTKTVKQSVLEKLPFISISIFFGILTIITQYHAGYINLNLGYTFIDRVFIGCSNIVLYFSKLAIPYNLSVFYPFSGKPTELLPFEYYIYTFIFVVSCFVLLIKRNRVKPELLFGFVFFLICMLPLVQFIPFGEAKMADRYTYLSSIGIFIIIATGIDKIIKTHKIFYVFIILYLGFTIYQTIARIALWQKNFYLFEDANNKFPQNAIILNNLASVQNKNGDVKQALENLSNAIIIDSGYADAYYNRGVIYSKINNPEWAINDYSRVIKLNPKYTKAFYNRGNVFLKQKKYKEAITDFDKVIILSPYYADAYNNRGLAKSSLNNFSGAISDFTYAIMINPQHSSAYFNRGLCYGQLKNFDRSIQDFDKCINIKADYSEAYYYRGLAKFDTGNIGCYDLIKAANLGFQPAFDALNKFCR